MSNVTEERKVVYRGRKKVWTLEALVPAGEQDFAISKNLDGNNIFSCKEIGGAFETLKEIGGDIVDNGVCYHRIKISDAGTDYQFTDNFIPADLMLALGRRKSDRATNNLTTAQPSNPLYKFKSFQHDFRDKLEVRVANDSNIDLKIWIVFEGYETRISKVRV